MSRLKHRDVLFQVKSVDPTGEFSGYGSVFSVVDSQRDVVQPGAFKNTLAAWHAKSKYPAMLWQHQMSQPIGLWTKMAEDEKGLYAEGRILLEAGDLEKRAYAHLKAGSVSGLSIGYTIPDGGIEYDPKADIFKLGQVDLLELSVVTAPANDLAQVDSVKSALESPTRFEFLLCEAGLTRTQAKALMRGGYEALLEGDEQGLEDAALVAAIEALTRKYRSAA